MSRIYPSPATPASPLAFRWPGGLVSLTGLAPLARAATVHPFAHPRAGVSSPELLEPARIPASTKAGKAWEGDRGQALSSSGFSLKFTENSLTVHVTHKPGSWQELEVQVEGCWSCPGFL